MFIDLHMHERLFSKDSFLALSEIVELAKKRGLDAVCITDHDDIGIREYAEKYSKEIGYPIFVGYEFFSLQGDIVAFGVPEVPKERISAQDFVDYVKAQNGVCIAAHPFRNNRRGLEENLLTVKGLDGLEVLNGSTDAEACNKAREYALRLGIKTVGASDCHVREKVGICATWFPKDVHTLEEFIEAIRTETLFPALYREGGYEVLKGELYEKPGKIDEDGRLF